VITLEGKCVCGGRVKIEQKNDGELYVFHTTPICGQSKFEDQDLTDQLRTLLANKKSN